MFLELMSAVEHELSPTIMHSYRTYFPFRCIDDTYLQFFSVGNRDHPLIKGAEKIEKRSSHTATKTLIT